MVYLQILTRAQVFLMFRDFRVVRYDATTGKMLPVAVIPDVAFYEVIPGIQELEMLP